jgi:uncharacterized protein YhjY with autotransporter beta-barrel domain
MSTYTSDALASHPRVAVCRRFPTARARLLLGTSAVAAVLAIAAPASGADNCQTLGQSCNVTKLGTPATPAGSPDGNGKKGGDGGDAGSIDLGLSGATVYQNYGLISPVNAVSLGAAGAQGSNATRYGFNNRGGDGGKGGAAGAVTLNVGAEVGGLSLSAASALTIAANGGEGGAAGVGNNSGHGGVAGVGGAGGMINATIGGGWSAQHGAALFVQSQGGTGGRGRESTAVGYSTQAPDGNRGGDGGAVSVSLLGYFNSNAGGARIVSAGGDGGHGGKGGSASGGSGGNGGNGGSGGSTTVTLGPSATVYNAALLNPALWVQSFGGEGGSGGSGGSGGAGGTGGAAGNVTVVLNGGSLVSGGQYAAGLLAQSLGGAGAGGGSGGSWAIGPIGGPGSRGGAAGDVSVTGTGARITVGSDASQINSEGSAGVLAQSVGGGGGTGGDASGPLAVGGRGGNAVAGKDVTVDLQATIKTFGLNAEGIAAQSIGGGGGKGGDASGTSGLINLVVGGDAGGGGGGGKVSASLQQGSVITTAGDHGDGMLLQSIGGGGGSAGAGYSSAYSGGLGASVAVGGKGGKGGDGGIVTFAPGQTTTNAGQITTSGADAFGISGQSIGGGGGEGGESAAKMRTYGVGQYPSIAVAASIGGSGGTGGAGGQVTLGNQGTISTTGDGAIGVLGQAIGGGGGAGGDASAEATSSGKGVNITATTAIGGKGGSAGAGGSVRIANNGAINTAGEAANGVLAQSIGGGGGVGGFGDGSATAENGKFNLAVSLSLGGNGSGGGLGGSVTVSNAGQIVTSGDGAIGIAAQSIGGGGGDAGGAAGAASGSLGIVNYVGGVAGTGGGAQGTVSVSNSGSVTTTGADAAAIFAQSVGGGGGIGGQAAAGASTALNLAVAGSKIAAQSITLTLGVGGRGGTGGYASDVNVDNTGALSTSGAMSDAIVAQAIGGGGGAGGEAAMAVSQQNTGGLTVGGTGGSGGNGGRPTVSNSGGIVTTGSEAAGIIAQSVAGGGRIGGISASSASAGTDGKSAFGSLSIGVGGSGGGPGTSGQAVVVDSGNITTTAHDSIGIIAQSIAGGGGIAQTLATDLDTNGGAEPIYAVNDVFGGSGPTNGASGLVRVTTQQGGDIYTSGDNSYGILAQSIAGGGGLILGGTIPGNGKFFGTGSMNGSVINDPNGNPGNSGMWITTAGSIFTTGKGATGILAQSIGGGGGLAGNYGWTQQLFNFTPTTNHNGAGGTIAITVDAGSTIRTSGSNAPAIWAQSIGGGGGRVTTNAGVFNGTAGGTGKGGAVNITVSGTVSATGQASMGIFAQSVGDRTSTSPITITVNQGGLVSGGPLFNGNGNTTPALYLDHGGMSAATPNVVVNYGTLTSVGQERGTAIFGNYGYTAVQNFGLIVGSINLANNGGTGTVTNNGTIRAGSEIALGGGQMLNNGVLEIGAQGAIAVTTVGGDFVQGHSGELLIDTNPLTGAADILDVSGQADIDGVVKLITSTLSKSAPIEVLEATGGVSLTVGAQALQHPQGLPIWFEEIVSGHELDLQPEADFVGAAKGLGLTRLGVAGGLQHAWDSGATLGQGFAQIADLQDPSDYAGALNTLSGQAFGDLAAVRWRSTLAFLDAVDQGCRPDVAVEGCAWARFEDAHTARGTTSDALGYIDDQQAFEAGSEVRVAANTYLRAAFAFGFESFTGDAQTALVAGENQTGALGVSWRPGPLTLSADVDIGHADFDSIRLITVGEVVGSAAAQPGMWSADVRLCAAYDAKVSSAWTLTPFARLDLAAVDNAGFTETGTTDFDLRIEGQTRWAPSGEAGLQISGQARVRPDLTIRPMLSVSAEGLGEPDWSPVAQFAQAPAEGFRSMTRLPPALGKVAAAIQLYDGGKWSLQLQYAAQAGDGYLAQSGGGSFMYRF